jgi:hypothetical protein
MEWLLSYYFPSCSISRCNVGLDHLRPIDHAVEDLLTRANGA